ncbi:hypothetical protein [Deinococcus aquaedulcis]|uniref:hypothetical protein n=1 Tax=Deinococcus aquaedulcis TaxID=2840455 RepID=UPI001C8386B8|nr:hypothetical protein [Deinococcus aquaedulcis]
MSFSAATHAALWPALLSLPLTWEALPEMGVAVPGGLHLVRREAPDGTLFLRAVLHTSEDFQALLDGRGDYTEEELDDPYAVIDDRWAEASERLQPLRAEAAQTLGAPSPSEEGPAHRTHWLLADRTVAVGLDQADQDSPIEVCVWLLPPGRTLRHLDL